MPPGKTIREQVNAVTGIRRNRKSIHIGYQGVSGAYSQWAAERISTERHWTCRTTGFRTFGAVAEAVVEKRVDLGMMPVENTLAGSINETYDLLRKHALFIVGEEIVPIVHCLAAVRRVPLHKIKRIYSHPQALAQCSLFLNDLPGAEVHAYFDTAAAMQKVAADQDPTAAAIAGDRAARQYGLTVLKKQIADHSENYTRFLLVSARREKLAAGVAAKTSLVLAVDHREGALLEALNVLHDHGVNMTKLESRPQHGSPWQYFFYLDFEGNESDANVVAMLASLRKVTHSLRVLGSYVSRTVSKSGR